jgi:hypothetical protein
MKKGTKVKLIDGSYSTRIENGEIRGTGNIVTGCIYEVMATGMKLPTDYYPCNASSTHWNDTILRNIATDKLVFVESRFIRELSKEVPFLTAVKAYSEGKTIRVVDTNKTESIFKTNNRKSNVENVGYWLKCSIGGAMSTDMVLNGTWYIQEDSHE